jgi:alcohol dehydrogenase
MPPSLSALNISSSELPQLATEAARQWTAQFNPRPITASDFEAIYAAAL